MLHLYVGATEYWDPVHEKFGKTEGELYLLEHSLYTIAKWEERFKEPFLTQKPKTPEQYGAYVEIMSVEKPLDIERLTEENILAISDYINSDLTATTVRAPEEQSAGRVTTSEVMYATMTLARIPWEAQHWHLSRLLMLFRVVGDMSSEKKKMPKSEVLKQNREINRLRREQLGSKG